MAIFLASVTPHHLSRSAETERADVLALLDEKIRACRKRSIEHRHFEAMRDEIEGGLHEREEE